MCDPKLHKRHRTDREREMALTEMFGDATYNETL